MRFALMMLALMYVGRRIGWSLSRSVFYPDRGVSLSLLLTLWGSAVAWAVRCAVDTAQPGSIMRWIFGYALGAYVAIPNYGLFIESTIPEEDRARHLTISGLPLITYMVMSALLPVNSLSPVETLFVVVQWFLFAAVGYWLALRHRRLWRAIGLLLTIAFIVNACIALVDLALIGDALPGGVPSPRGWDPTHAQAIGEYAGTSMALIGGWICGRHQGAVRDSVIPTGAQAA